MWLPDYIDDEDDLKKVFNIPQDFNVLVSKQVDFEVLGPIIKTPLQGEKASESMFQFKKTLYKEFGRDTALTCSIALPRITTTKNFQKYHGNCRNYEEHVTQLKKDDIKNALSLQKDIHKPKMATEQRKALLAESIKFIGLTTFALGTERVS